MPRREVEQGARAPQVIKSKKGPAVIGSAPRAPPDEEGRKNAPRLRGPGASSDTPKKKKKKDKDGHGASSPTSRAEPGASSPKSPKRTKKIFAGPDVELKLPEAKQAAKGLGLTMSELQMLRKSFDQIDISGDGDIDREELIEALNERTTPLTDAVFALLDLDGNGRISFDEFVVCLATYCLYTKEDILQFMFNIFDVDQSGALDDAEFKELCRAVNCSEPLFAGNFASAMQQFDENADGVIDFKEFRALNQKFPMLLFPAFRMQEGMQKLTLGATKWRKILEDYKTIRECPRGQTPVYRFFWCFKKNNEVARNRSLRVDVHYIDAIRPRLTAFAAEASKRPSRASASRGSRINLPSPPAPPSICARVALLSRTDWRQVVGAARLHGLGPGRRRRRPRRRGRHRERGGRPDEAVVALESAKQGEPWVPG